ncbi:hypothetical protein BCR35DRAFT_306155 [Leucosporidium creatinivorum]|uniref:Uncharacterized protein n=1 Tax=Leucosporidium creatinivorum TaxID=106004 RepID=A0A1Y2EVR2_9BASI|nr:hypothetical protein BCR35DRAFT_306155 [Leucosporidium creatinivorum]
MIGLSVQLVLSTTNAHLITFSPQPFQLFPTRAAVICEFDSRAHRRSHRRDRLPIPPSHPYMAAPSVFRLALYYHALCTLLENENNLERTTFSPLCSLLLLGAHGPSSIVLQKFGAAVLELDNSQLAPQQKTARPS